MWYLCKDVICFVIRVAFVLEIREACALEGGVLMCLFWAVSSVSIGREYANVCSRSVPWHSYLSGVFLFL